MMPGFQFRWPSVSVSFHSSAVTNPERSVSLSRARTNLKRLRLFYNFLQVLVKVLLSTAELCLHWIWWLCCKRANKDVGLCSTIWSGAILTAESWWSDRGASFSIK